MVFTTSTTAPIKVSACTRPADLAATSLTCMAVSASGRRVTTSTLLGRAIIQIQIHGLRTYSYSAIAHLALLVLIALAMQSTVAEKDVVSTTKAVAYAGSLTRPLTHSPSSRCLWSHANGVPGKV